MTYEEKVDFLLNVTEELNKNLSDLRKEMKNDIDAVKSRVEKTEERIDQRIDEVSSKMKSVLIGDVKKEVIGAILFIFGLIFRTIPGELSYFYSILI